MILFIFLSLRDGYTRMLIAHITLTPLRAVFRAAKLKQKLNELLRQPWTLAARPGKLDGW